MQPVRILIIDDHAMFRTGLRMFLAAEWPDAEVLEAGALSQAIQNTTEKPDAILLDIHMPGLNGVDGIPVLKQKWPTAPILMLSSETDPDTVRSAIARGASAFVSKAQAAGEILKLTMNILSGDVNAIGSSSVADEPTTRLTPRQCEVLELMCEGLPNKLIARRLELSENTVRGHVQAILAYLKVSSRSEAAFVARRQGLIG